MEGETLEKRNAIQKYVLAIIVLVVVVVFVGAILVFSGSFSGSSSTAVPTSVLPSNSAATTNGSSLGEFVHEFLLSDALRTEGDTGLHFANCDNTLNCSRDNKKILTFTGNNVQLVFYFLAPLAEGQSIEVTNSSFKYVDISFTYDDKSTGKELSYEAKSVESGISFTSFSNLELKGSIESSESEPSFKIDFHLSVPADPLANGTTSSLTFDTYPDDLPNYPGSTVGDITGESWQGVFSVEFFISDSSRGQVASYIEDDLEANGWQVHSSTGFGQEQTEINAMKNERELQIIIEEFDDVVEVFIDGS